MRSLLGSFKYASKGIIYCINGERNFRIHLTATAYVILLSLFFSLSALEYAALLITFSLVIGAEMINTAIEILVNIEVEGYHRLAKSAKDVAAGLVLFCALFSVGVGCFIFIPKYEGFFRMIDFFRANPFFILVGIFVLVLSLCFIFIGPKEMKKKAS